jgi:hypothetical protein
MPTVPKSGTPILSIETASLAPPSVHGICALAYRSMILPVWPGVVLLLARFPPTGRDHWTRSQLSAQGTVPSVTRRGMEERPPVPSRSKTRECWTVAMTTSVPAPHWRDASGTKARIMTRYRLEPNARRSLSRHIPSGTPGSEKSSALLPGLILPMRIATGSPWNSARGAP